MSTQRITPALMLAVAGAAVALILAAWILLGGSEGRRYSVVLENAGQLVKGNQVLIGGKPVGSVKSVSLMDDSQARVEIETDRDLHEGTTAVVRATSLSGVANRYISLEPGPDNFPELGDGATIAADRTTSPVDLDQLFDTFDDPTRKALQDVIQGSAASYAGREADANEAYKYFSPALVSTDRLLQELGRDDQTLSDFLVSSSRVVTAVASRRDDLAELVPNANKALGAVAENNRSLDQALENLPPALRQANTTFFNLRDALDDLDPLVATAKPATRDLARFLTRLRPVTKRSTGVFSDLADATNLPGTGNDITDAVTELPDVRSRIASAAGPAVQAMNDSLPTLSFARPYMPDLLGAISKLGQVTAYYDADGHYARIQPAGMNLFHYNAGTQFLEPNSPADQFSDLTFDTFRRCPGGATQAEAGSNPFLDGGGLLSPTDCDATQVPPG